MDKVICSIIPLFEIGFVLAVDEFFVSRGLFIKGFLIAFGLVDFFEGFCGYSEGSVTVGKRVGVFIRIKLLHGEVFENFDSFCGNHRKLREGSLSEDCGRAFFCNFCILEGFRLWMKAFW